MFSNLSKQLCVCTWGGGSNRNTFIVEIKQTLLLILAGPAVVIRDLESQEAEEGGSVILNCELSKPGLHVEWKKETLVLICGEKYQTKQIGLMYELQIFDLRPEDSGSYSCCSEETISSASLVINGRTEVFFSRAISSQKKSFQSFLFYSSSHCFIIVLDFPLEIMVSLLLFINQLLQFFSRKRLRVKRWMKGTT